MTLSFPSVPCGPIRDSVFAETAEAFGRLGRRLPGPQRLSGSWGVGREPQKEPAEFQEGAAQRITETSALQPLGSQCLLAQKFWGDELGRGVQVSYLLKFKICNPRVSRHSFP